MFNSVHLTDFALHYMHSITRLTCRLPNIYVICTSAPLKSNANILALAMIQEL